METSLVTAMTVQYLSDQVDAEMRDVFSTRDMPLYGMMTCHLGWADEQGQPTLSPPRQRNHGVACLAANLATGGDGDTALPAAASVELTNGFAEIHDDVQRGNPKRDGRDAVWWTWGPAQAINAGDAMHALARLSLFRLHERGLPAETTFHAIQVLDRASLDLCEGRFEDLEAQERIDLSVEAYLRIASGKTAALYAGAMKLGAMVAGAGDDVTAALETCGSNVGMAVQVTNDLKEMWTEADAGPAPEVLNKTKLLPVAYAFEKANINQKRRLGDIYFKRVLEKDDVTALREVLEEIGARDYSEEVASKHRDAALAVLDGGVLSADGTDAIRQLLQSLLAD